MKVKSLLLASALLISAQSFASCYTLYSAKRTEAKIFLDESNLKQAYVEAGALATTTNIIFIAALSGSGGPLVSTVAGTGLVSSMYLAKKYIEFRIEDGVEAAQANIALLDSSLSLLKEARIGQGPHLQQAMAVINQHVSTDISMKDLADTINRQNEERLYCKAEDQIMSPAGILEVAIKDLSENL